MTGVDGSVRIGNCSGFYGDRLSAMQEMLLPGGRPGGLDYLTGDYLAELTMLILGKDTMRDASLGYARTFVRQAEECLGTALEQGTRIVVNAGGLNPTGLVEKLREVATGLGLDPSVGAVVGDDVRDLAEEHPPLKGALTANAYLGAFGIARALDAGADVVVTGRVTDASVVVGPAIAFHGWTLDQHDELAGAIVAGHVIECGTQATGGNFSGFKDLPHDGKALGFPIAEVAADGSSVITKHQGTGGAVTVDTVTAQLLYEIQSARYLNPDATVALDSLSVDQDGPDRVSISGVVGEPPPEQLKVCVNELGGWRNSAEFVLTGLDIDAKSDWLRSQLEPRLTGIDDVHWSMTPHPVLDAETEEGASCLLRVTVKDADQKRVAKPFTGAAVELALASYPGFTMTGPPAQPTPYGVYRPEYLPREVVTHQVVLPDGSSERIADPDGPFTDAGVAALAGLRGTRAGHAPDAFTRRAPLGSFVHARSGDKGGDANLGLWVAHSGDAGRHAARVDWLLDLVTPERIRELVPEAGELAVDVFCLENLGAVNVLIRGLLGQGVAASVRFDPQAKGLGEWVRSRMVSIPEELL